MELSLREIQLASLEILKVITAICDRHGISYYLDSGTLLGAVRHKGFIPWDDDIDIIFWRKDYNKLLETLEHELPDNLKLILPKHNKFFLDFIGKIINPSVLIGPDTELTNYYGNYINKAAVDLLVLDNANPRKILQKSKIILLKIIYAMAMGHRHSIDYSKYGFWFKVSAFLLSTIGKALPYKTIYGMYEKILQVDNRKDSHYCFGGLSTPPYLGRIIPTQCYSSSILLEFEGFLLNAPIGYDCILTITYGDYRTLPEETERTPSHAVLSTP
jgi:lipopolysaccharide cholinephosphotransferase